MLSGNVNKVAVVVAHPDDETLWAGGTILSHPGKDWNIFSLTRAGDDDRANRFHKALFYYGALGVMGDMDDGKEQEPLNADEVKETVLGLIGKERSFDLIITHGPKGEYTRHRRHEEVSSCVTDLWLGNKIHTEKLWLFAYEDGSGKHYPRPENRAQLFQLPDRIWNRKRHLIEKIYGFEASSWEARINPRTEAFWRFRGRDELSSWLNREGKK